jgi:hypothetical protein
VISGFLSLVWNNEVSACAEALAKQPSLLKERGGNTAGSVLHAAHSVEMLRLLIDAGADVNDVDSSGITPLHRAAQGADPNSVRLLLECGADPLAVDDHQQNALHWLSLEHHRSLHPRRRIVDTARLLIDAGTPIDASSDWGRRTPLHNNSRFGRLPVVRVLVKAGADPLKRDALGAHALHLAKVHPTVHAYLSRVVARRAKTDHSLGTYPLNAPAHLMTLSSDGTRVVTTHWPDTFSIWRLAPTIERLAVARTEGVRILSLAALPESGEFLASILNGGVERRSFDNPGIVLRTYEFEHASGAVAVNPAGTLAAVRAEYENVHIFDLDTGSITATIEGGEYTESIAWSPDGTRLAVAASYQGGTRVGIVTVDVHGKVTSERDVRRYDWNLPEGPFIDQVCGLSFAADSASIIYWETLRADHTSASQGFRGNVTRCTTSGELIWHTVIDKRMTANRHSLIDIGHSMGFHTQLAFSTGCDRIAVGLDDQIVELEATSGKFLRRRAIQGTARVVEHDPSHPSWLVATSNGLQRVSDENS